LSKTRQGSPNISADGAKQPGGSGVIAVAQDGEPEAGQVLAQEVGVVGLLAGGPGAGEEPEIELGHAGAQAEE